MVSKVHTGVASIADPIQSVITAWTSMLIPLTDKVAKHIMDQTVEFLFVSSRSWNESNMQRHLIFGLDRSIKVWRLPEGSGPSFNVLETFVAPSFVSLATWWLDVAETSHILSKLSSPAVYRFLSNRSVLESWAKKMRLFFHHTMSSFLVHMIV